MEYTVRRAKSIFFCTRTTAVCNVNNWVDETLGIIIKSKIAPEASNSITQILALLA
jgi:hypothetical protein